VAIFVNRIVFNLWAIELLQLNETFPFLYVGNKKHHTLQFCNVWCFRVVEMGGVEPPSKISELLASTRVVTCFV